MRQTHHLLRTSSTGFGWVLHPSATASRHTPLRLAHACERSGRMNCARTTARGREQQRQEARERGAHEPTLWHTSGTGSTASDCSPQATPRHGEEARCAGARTGRKRGAEARGAAHLHERASTSLPPSHHPPRSQRATTPLSLSLSHSHSLILSIAHSLALLLPCSRSLALSLWVSVSPFHSH